jgi:hypothetical protein
MVTLRKTQPGQSRTTGLIINNQKYAMFIKVHHSKPSECSANGKHITLERYCNAFALASGTFRV